MIKGKIPEKPGHISAALAVLALASLMAFASGCSSMPASGNVGNAQLRDLMSRGVQVVDVRTPGEFAGGHIAGAENVPVEDVNQVTATWDKSAPIAVYCQTGARSQIAMSYLEGQGFTHVYNLTAGIQAWDGKVVAGEPAAATGSIPVTGRPTMYEFASST